MKKIAKRIVSILLICILSVTSVPIVTATTNSDWTLSGRCSYDSATDVYTLIPDRTYTSGVMQYNDSISSDFSLSLDYYTGNRSGGEDSRYGGDGFAVFYYCEELKKGDYWRPTSGYSVEIDTYCDDGFEKGQIHENHVAINSSTANHIAVSPIVEAEDDDWHNLNIIVRSGICTVYIDGTERISHETPANNYDTLGIYCVTGAARNLHAVKNIEITTGADVSGEHFPEGYNFKEDSYNFENGSTTISKKYFTTLYGKEQGKLLYKQKKNAKGLCFGMAYTTAAFYQGLPSLTTNVRDLGTKTTIRIGNNYMSVYDYIVYSYIYQWSTACWPKYNDYTNINELYKIVKAHVSNNVLVPITIWNLKETSPGNYETTGAHTVLAVGFDENSIIVDDPNNKSGMERIKLTGGEEWEYSLPWKEGGIHSNNAALAYSLDVHIPYTLLHTGKTTTVHEDVLSSNTRDSSSSNIRTETYVEGMDKLDTDKLLMFVDSESYQIDSENLIEITDAIGTDESEADDIGNLYWVSEDKTVTISDITGEDNEIIIAGNDVSIGVKTQDSSVVTLTVDEEKDDISAKIDSMAGNEYSITFETTDENEEDLIATLTGTANGDEVVASETEDGIQVTGLNDITVTYETPDGTAETKADVTDGSTVNITVNDDENTVETDWQDKEETETDEECKHSDANHDGICDACSEDFTKGCSCNCHGNAFMQFLHKIVSFLRKLFGMTQYQYCNCGKAHW